MSAFGVLGLWESSVETLALVAVAVLLSLAIGIPVGVWAGLSVRVRRAITPALDVMQIMPTFAYLAPLALFFHIGAPAGAIATMIYSIPPAIRITALAVSQVSPRRSRRPPLWAPRAGRRWSRCTCRWPGPRWRWRSTRRS
ncbi:ABC transporter permease subunit [Nonomuraea antimicrobica]